MLTRRLGGGWPEWVAPVMVTGVVVALGLWQLDSRSFWYDEAFSAYAARAPIAEFPSIAVQEFGWALYYLVLRVWSSLGSSDATLRALSVVAAGATVPALYLLGRRIFGREVGLLAIGLLAVHALFIRYAQEARVYALMALATTLLMLAFLRAVEGSRRDKAVWAATAVVCAYLHFFAAFVVLAQAVWLVGSRRLTRAWILAFVIVGGATLPLVASFILSEGLQWIPPLSANLYLETLSAVTGSTYDPWVGSGDATMLLLGLSLILAAIARSATDLVDDGRGRTALKLGLGWAIPMALVPVLGLELPPPGRYGLYLALATLLALHIDWRRLRGDGWSGAREFALLWSVPAVVTSGLLILGASPRRLGVAIVLVVLIGLLVVRFGRPRAATRDRLPFALGWLPALTLIMGVAIIRPGLVWHAGALGLALLAAMLVAATLAARRPRPFSGLVALWWLVPLAVAALLSYVKPMYIDRYFMAVVPAGALLAAAAIQGLSWRSLRLVATVTLLVASTMSVIASYQRPTDDFRSAAAYLGQQVEPADRVLYAPDTGFLSFPLAHYMDVPPTEIRLPATESEAATTLGSAAGTGTRIWLVIGFAALNYEGAAATLRLRAFYERQESLQFGTLRVERWLPLPIRTQATGDALVSGIAT